MVLNEKKWSHIFEAVSLACMQSHLAEESGVEACQLVGHVLFVHVVELVERRSGREAPLHQVQHRHHTFAGRTPKHIVSG